MQALRNILLVAKTLLLEAWRRREIYVIVFFTTALLVALRFIHFFEIEGIGKFYREVSLKAMNYTTALTVILLAARQLPREFASRTIYPLLAKPVARWQFLLGKYLGVLAAGAFCYALFMIVFSIGSVTLSAPVHLPLFFQGVYLHLLSIAVLVAMVFLLSMLFNADAAITLGAVFYVTSQLFLNLMSYLYDYVEGLGRWVLLALHYLLPQLTLFDVSSKIVHSYRDSELVWGTLPATVMLQLTAYALVYAVAFLGLSALLFRRRAL